MLTIMQCSVNKIVELEDETIYKSEDYLTSEYSVGSFSFIIEITVHFIRLS